MNAKLVLYGVDGNLETGIALIVGETLAELSFEGQQLPSSCWIVPGI